MTRKVQLRLFILLLLCTLVSACSWFKKNTGNCLDDNSCETLVSAEKRKAGVFPWYYCYGVSRDEAWDCSLEEAPQKIRTIQDRAAANTLEKTLEETQTEAASQEAP